MKCIIKELEVITYFKESVVFRHVVYGLGFIICMLAKNGE
jgi:hypothetical protein